MINTKKTPQMKTQTRKKSNKDHKAVEEISL